MVHLKKQVCSDKNQSHDIENWADQKYAFKSMECYNFKIFRKTKNKTYFMQLQYSCH